MSKKLRVFCLVLASTITMQGCSTTSETSSTQELATIDLLSESTNESTAESTSETSALEDEHHLDIEVNEEEHTFVIHADNDVLDEDLCGSILTYSNPTTAPVYKINHDMNDHWLYNPFSEWQYANFAGGMLLLGDGSYNEDGTEFIQLSIEEVNSVIDSLTRVDADDFEQMDIIESAFPDANFSDYVLRSTFPPISSDLYLVSSFDEELGEEVIIDTVRDREINLYIVRQNLSGIPLGLPIDIYWGGFNYYDADDECIYASCSYAFNMYYDGTDVYEIHTDESELEIFAEDLSVLTLDEAFELANSAIYDRLFSWKMYENFNTRIYEAELIYLPLNMVEISNEEYESDMRYSLIDDDNWYLYPCWAFYIHYSYTNPEADGSNRGVIIINAVNDDVYLNY